MNAPILRISPITPPPALPPVLAGPQPSGTLLTQTSATLSATTDSVNGTFYGVIDSAANISGINAGQIEAGQNKNGVAAISSNFAPVLSTVPSAILTGLSATTAYSYACVQHNVLGDSNIVQGTFTTASPPPSAGAPILLQIDRVDGQVTDTGDGIGALLRLVGLNFGAFSDWGVTSFVSIGGVNVDNYRYLTSARGVAEETGTRPDQELCCQIGALSGLTPGVAYPVVITTSQGTSNANYVLGDAIVFTVQPGKTYYVNNVTGNDLTFVANDPAHPARFFQSYSSGTALGIWAVIQPGDTIIAQYTGVAYTDQVGFDARFCRFRLTTGNAPTGVINHGYIHLTADAGASGANARPDVHVQSPITTGKGCFMGCGTSNSASGGGKYVTVSGFRIDCAAGPQGSTDSGPVNLQTGADNWLVTCNDISWPSTDSGSTTHQKAGGIAGNGNVGKLNSNYVHDIGGGGASFLENHGIYLDGSNNCAANYEVAFNVIARCTTGSLFQCHNQQAGDRFTNINIHNNWMDTSAKYGINLDSFQSVNVWNNIVQGTYRNGFRIANDGTLSSVFCQFENNTLYNCYLDPTGSYPGLISQESSPSGTFAFNLYNNVLMLAASRTNTNVSYIQDNGNKMTVRRGQYYDAKGLQTSKYSQDTTGQYGNPLFTSAGTNFALLGGSPCLGFAATSVINPSYDYFLNPNPRTGQTIRSVGASA